MFWGNFSTQLLLIILPEKLDLKNWKCENEIEMTLILQLRESAYFSWCYIFCWQEDNSAKFSRLLLPYLLAAWQSWQKPKCNKEFVLWISLLFDSGFIISGRKKVDLCWCLANAAAGLIAQCANPIFRGYFLPRSARESSL